MRDPEASSQRPAPSSEPSRYRAQLLSDVEPTARGLAHRDGDERSLLDWSRVRRAFAAEIGEPEGVRTIVFDLVLGVEGRECVALRFDAEPGDEARSVAQRIELLAGRDLCDPSLLTVAADGFATRSYPDLEPFDEACLVAVRRKPFA